MIKIRTAKETAQIFNFIKDLISSLQAEFPGDTYSHWIGITPTEEGDFVPCLYFYVQEVGLHLKSILYDHEAMRDIDALVREARAKTNEFIAKKKAFEEAQQAVQAGQERK